MQTAHSSSMGVVSALVVDDNAFDRRRLVRLANSTGIDFYLKEVADVTGFSRILDEEKFDVIYVDLNLAGDNGIKLLPGVRAHPVNCNAGMIMIAGDDNPEVALQALRAGFADFIGKDALTAAGLERATLHAVQKSRLTQAAFSARAETKGVEDVLRSFADACSQEMRPMMARMMRQVRQMKAEADKTGHHAAALAEIERTFTRVEEFFQDLASMAIEGNLSSVLGEERLAAGSAMPLREPDAAPASTAPVQPKRPPRSGRLFSR